MGERRERTLALELKNGERLEKEEREGETQPYPLTSQPPDRYS
jgi:hypothetical protein